MRLLFEIDTKDYNKNGTAFVRPSVRGIIIKNEKIAMIYSKKYNYYKFAGGGIEPGESHADALIREIKEETGFSVIPQSIKEYGYVHRVQKGINEDMFIQDNYYYFCDIEDEIGEQNLDDYENDEQFTPEYVTPKHAICVNQNESHGSKSNNTRFCVILNRETQVLKMLADEILNNDTQ